MKTQSNYDYIVYSVYSKYRFPDWIGFIAGITNMGNREKEKRAGSQTRQFPGKVRDGRTRGRTNRQGEEIHLIVSKV